MIKLSRPVVIIYGVLCMLFWGMSFVWSKIVFEYYSPITTIFIRLVISSVILYIIWFIWYRSNAPKRADFKYFLASAFFSPFCYFIGESFGLQEVSSTIAAVIIAMIPVFSPLVAWLTFREKLTWLNFVGLLVSFTGIIIMILRKDLSLDASLKGILLLFFAVAAALAYTVVVRKLSNSYNPVTIVVFQNSLGALFFLPWFLLVDFQDFIQVSPDFRLINSIVLLALFASTLAFILFTAVIKAVGVSRANIYSNLIPVFTAVFSFFILNESFTFAKILGMLIVISGVILAQSGKLKSEKQKLSP
jgi:drug/metabolite transporter (DMT)-like permease